MSTTTPGDHERRSDQLDGLVDDDNRLQLVELPGMWINPRAIACLRYQPNVEDIQQAWTEILFTSGEVRHTPTGITPSLIVDRIAQLTQAITTGTDS